MQPLTSIPGSLHLEGEWKSSVANLIQTGSAETIESAIAALSPGELKVLREDNDILEMVIWRCTQETEELPSVTYGDSYEIITLNREIEFSIPKVCQFLLEQQILRPFHLDSKGKISTAKQVLENTLISSSISRCTKLLDPLSKAGFSIHENALTRNFLPSINVLTIQRLFLAPKIISHLIQATWFLSQHLSLDRFYTAISTTPDATISRRNDYNIFQCLSETCLSSQCRLRFKMENVFEFEQKTIDNLPKIDRNLFARKLNGLFDERGLTTYMLFDFYIDNPATLLKDLIDKSIH